jgi:hypothetical protein
MRFRQAGAAMKIVTGGSVLGGIVLGRIVLGGMVAAAFTSLALAHNDGRFPQSDPEISAWIHGLTDQNGAGCCDTADGYPAEVDWDTEANGYRVRIDGEWKPVPPSAVITKPNKLGYAVVWYFKAHDQVLIRCFLPGSGI